MTTFSAARPDIAPSSRAALQAMVSAYLGRYRGATRSHTESDLRIFLTWSADHELDPLAARRIDIERYVRWLQDVCCYQPSTVSRRLSVESAPRRGSLGRGGAASTSPGRRGR